MNDFIDDMNLNEKKIGFGITGSFCTSNLILNSLEELKNTGADIFCFVTKNVLVLDNRFFKASDFINKIEKIIERKIISSIVEAEKFGPFTPLDCMIISPITGNTLAKLSVGITDNAVLMSSKTTLRNRRPVVLAPFTNDALGLNGVNIMRLLNAKKIFFVPFGQDDPVNKPTSMISDLSKLLDTVKYALKDTQIQPVIIENFKNKSKINIKNVK
ncbi:MAG: dipicolinate synthase subunit B [Clostridiales bacterium]|jgi:dipicolinate synthase subunit B|nr:dipicolinate synthase subunit B [Clostridiales bacterium]